MSILYIYTLEFYDRNKVTSAFHFASKLGNTICFGTLFYVLAKKVPFRVA